ncbi:MAG: heparan-alpha-glucosaminide N-acetyltransferase domain-containing protein [Candidatus Hermodarchaeota archaeon]
MKRVKTIDTIRGCCIFLMVLAHMLSWWVRPEDYWLTSILHSFLGDIAAGGFLFVSGLSAIISYRSRFKKIEVSEDYNIEQAKVEYLVRAMLIFVAALIYNSATAIGTLDPSNIWKWYVPLTIAISLFLAYPFFKTPKLFRLTFAFIIWIAHYFILSFLLPYQGQYNIFGVIFFILYNEVGLHPILNYFSFFLIGTVIGDIMFEISLRNDQNEKLSGFKNKLWFPSLIMGPILILFGVLLFFPYFLTHGSFSSIAYSLGVLLTSFSILLIIEEFEVIKVKKSYRFFYFYSYYSLTIYFSHNIIYFIFLDRLNAVTIWFAVVGTYVLLTLLIRFVYKKFSIKASLKAQIGRISLVLIKKIEAKKLKVKTS